MAICRSIFESGIEKSTNTAVLIFCQPKSEYNEIVRDYSRTILIDLNYTTKVLFPDGSVSFIFALIMKNFDEPKSGPHRSILCYNMIN